MLAQGYRFTIDDFVWEDWLDKRKVKVIYAGEMIVDLEQCTYDVNWESGTYQPARDDVVLDKVRQHFADNELSTIKVPSLCPEGVKLKTR